MEFKPVTPKERIYMGVLALYGLLNLGPAARIRAWKSAHPNRSAAYRRERRDRLTGLLRVTEPRGQALLGGAIIARSASIRRTTTSTRLSVQIQRFKAAGFGLKTEGIDFPDEK